MRVVGGRARGRKLQAPHGDATRPTSDFVREAIFNVLQPVIELEGAAAVDLFAGSGALGIEALSRGAATCVFVDSDRRALDSVRRNLAATGLAGGTVVACDVGTWVRRGDGAGSFDIAFADPPYSYGRWIDLALLDAQVVVAESDRQVELGDGWRVLRVKQYGGTVVTLFEPRS